MKSTYDAVIIGAGPAGTSCAKTLIGQGADILIVDMRLFPRYKACGGLLAPRGQEFIAANFGELPPEIICDVSSVTTKLSRTGNGYLRPVDLEWLNLHRHLLDHWLIQKAGIAVQQQHVYRGHAAEKSHITVTLMTDGTRREIRTKYLIGADGGNSLVRRTIDTRFLSENRYLYLQYIYEGTAGFADDTYYFLTGKKYTDLYACFCKKNGLIYIGTTFRAANRNNGYLDTVIRKLDEVFGLNLRRRVRGEGCAFGLSPTRKLFNTGVGDVLLIGESAGLISSFGEGIPSALISGKAAAEAICGAAGNTSALEIYTEAIRPEIDLLKSTMINIRL